MRVIFLTFESFLTVLWFWCAFGTFSFYSQKSSPYIEHPDYGTLISGLLFLAFGIGTAAMLYHEIRQLVVARRNAGLLAIQAAQGHEAPASPAPEE